VLAVLGHEETALERVVLGSEAKPEGVAVAPGERLDVLLRVSVNRRPQDGAGAHAVLGGVLERLDEARVPGRGGARLAVVRGAAGEVVMARLDAGVAALECGAGVDVR